MQKPYRICVVGVFSNAKGQVLAGERSDLPGVWQLPQGGVEEGETLKDAVLREMHEELGLANVVVLKEPTLSFKYDFPKQLDAAIAKKFKGQQQWCFLLKFPSSPLSVENLKGDGEFLRFAWLNIEEVLDKTATWKQACYRSGLEHLGLIEAKVPK